MFVYRFWSTVSLSVFAVIVMIEAYSDEHRDCRGNVRKGRVLVGLSLFGISLLSYLVLTIHSSL